MYSLHSIIVYECPNSDMKSPIGYKKISGKWYKAYEHKKHFYDALEVCHAEKGTLVEFKTEEDIAALEVLRGINESLQSVRRKLTISVFVEFLEPDKGYFTGLTNFDNVQCDDDHCLNQLHWASDGGALTIRNSLSLHMLQVESCTEYRNGKIKSVDCADERSFICQFSCDESKCLSLIFRKIKHL